MNKIIYTLTCCTLILCSCSDWLDVKPKTNVEEEDLFRNEQGFKEALTGVYIKMSETSLYGREMTYGFLDMLAQRYYNDISFPDYSDKTWYTYPSTNTEGYVNTFWTGNYNLIANLNNLIANIDKRGHVIRDEYRNIIKGEALGLRSFLYFDLLRMFGPIYKDNPSSPSIPYRTQFNRDVAKLLPAEQVIDSIIDCLHKAETLLENDPMNISFPIYSKDENPDIDPFLNYRFNRMNKYAVKAELARAYLWKGNKTYAYKYAKEVLDAKSNNESLLFTLITDNSQDPICSTELIFSLSMDSQDFKNRIEQDFRIANGTKYIFLGDVNRLYEIFDTQNDGQNDMRLKSGVGFNISPNGAYTLKFNQNNIFSYALRNNMPLIRLPEMYYIMAECTDDLQEATNYISMIRGARGVDELPTFNNEEEKIKNIEKEYRKEFYGEGQLWFFYKRHGYETFMFCPVSKMTEANYRFSIPDDEIALGNIN